MPSIKAKMSIDCVSPYLKHNEKIPVVIESDHPRFGVGTRLDWGFVQVAIEDGWTVTIEPYEVNRSNCTHPEGFDYSGARMSGPGEGYRLYMCPICYAERGVLIANESGVVNHYPTDHKWDYSQNII